MTDTWPSSSAQKQYAKALNVAQLGRARTLLLDEEKPNSKSRLPKTPKSGSQRSNIILLATSPSSSLISKPQTNVISGPSPPINCGFLRWA